MLRTRDKYDRHFTRNSIGDEDYSYVIAEKDSNYDEYEEDEYV